MEKNNYTCLICGYIGLVEKPYDEYGCPSHEVCPCCGFEFGFDDHEKNGKEKYRKNWISTGFPFFNKKKEPSGWSKEKMLNQLKNIEERPK